jgi:hypothetical protein
VPAAPSEFGSPQEAEQWTRDNLGIRTVDYGEATAVGASIVTHGLATAWASGMDLPRVVVFSAEASWGEAEVARMNPAYGGRLELNPTSPYWAGTMARIVASGQPQIHGTRSCTNSATWHTGKQSVPPGTTTGVTGVERHVTSRLWQGA